MAQNLISDNALTLFLHDATDVATSLKVVAHGWSELEVDPLREVVGYPYSKSACNVNEKSKWSGFICFSMNVKGWVWLDLSEYLECDTG